MAENESLDIEIRARTEDANKRIESFISNLYKTGNQIKYIKSTMKDGFLDKQFISATNGVKQMNYELNESGQIIKYTEKVANGAKKSMSSMFDAGKLYLFWNLTKRIRTTISGWVTDAIDFEETTNLFNVSMGKSVDQATRFQNKLSETFGTARAEMMKYQSTFKNILSGLGDLSSETTEKISETLTRMGLDYSSLYNISQQSAMEKFQSALTGSIRPIRSTSGYDVSDLTIGAKARELGVDKTSKELTQIEKRILRIIVLMEQMGRTGAMNDLARTIESPANQIRVLKNQVQELGVWLGNVFMGTIGAILPYINGFVMALKEIVKMFAIFVGFKSTTTGLGEAFESVDETTDSIAGGLGSAAKAAKELKRTLMGFDVLNVITTPKEPKGGGGGSGVGEIDPKILDALKEYDSIMDGVRMKAIDIRDKILEWLGVTDGTYTRLKNILDIVKLVGLALIGWKISRGVTSFIANLLGGTLAQQTAALRISLALTMVVAGVTLLINGVKRLMKGEVNAYTIAEAILGSLLFAGGLVTMAALTIKIPIVIQGATMLATIGATLGNIAKLVGGVASAIAGLMSLFGGLVSMWQNGFSAMNASAVALGVALLPLGAFLLTMSPHIALIVAIIAAVVAVIGVLTVALFRNEAQIKSVKKAEEDLRQATVDLENANNSYINSVDKAENSMKRLESAEKAAGTTGKALYQQVEEGTLDYANMTDAQKELYKAYIENEQAQKELKESTEALREAKKNETLASLEHQLALGKESKDYDNLKRSVIDAMNQGKISTEEARSFMERAMADMSSDSQQTFMEDIPDNIKEGIDPDRYSSNWTKFKKWFGEKWEGMKDVVGNFFKNHVAPWFTAEKWKEMGRKAVDGLKTTLQNLDVKFKLPHFSWGSKPATGWIAQTLKALSLPTSLPKLEVSWYQDGGLPEVGEMFVAREAGPELVGRIGSSSAVVNNDQIVESVSRGVAQAVSSVLGTGGASYNLYLDGKQLTDVVQERIYRNAVIAGA